GLVPGTLTDTDSGLGSTGSDASRPCAGQRSGAETDLIGKCRVPVYSAWMLRQMTFALMIALAARAAPAAEPRSGIDLSAIDPSARSQDDFWQYANGKWLASPSIPADRGAWDAFSELREKTQGQLRSTIEAIDPADRDHPARRKLADLYASFMDEAAVER